MFVDYAECQEIYSQEIDSDAFGVCNEVSGILDTLKRRYSLAQEQCFDIKVILCELLQNAIKHGNNSDASKKIHLDVWYKENNSVLGISVKDQGNGFPPSRRSYLDKSSRYIADAMLMDESGRGLCIVKELCDDIEFNAMGNIITVTKKL